MAKNSLPDWSTNDALNTDLGGTNIAEGCAPSGINDAIRKLMAQIASFIVNGVVRIGLGAGQLGNTVSIGWSGTRLKAQVDSTDQGAFVFDSQLNTALATKQDALGFIPPRQGGGVGQTAPTANAVTIGWSSGGRLKATVDTTDLGNIVFDSQLATKQPNIGYTPANKAGEAFSGAVSAPSLTAGSGGIGADGPATFNGPASFGGGVAGPVTFSGAVGAASFSTTGAIGAGTTLTVAGAGSFGGPIAREGNFFVDMLNGNPIFVVKNQCFLLYKRDVDHWVFVINNQIAASLDGGGNLTIRGSLFQNGNPG